MLHTRKRKATAQAEAIARFDRIPAVVLTIDGAESGRRYAVASSRRFATWWGEDAVVVDVEEVPVPDMSWTPDERARTLRRRGIL